MIAFHLLKTLPWFLTALRIKSKPLHMTKKSLHPLPSADYPQASSFTWPLTLLQPDKTLLLYGNCRGIPQSLKTAHRPLEKTEIWQPNLGVYRNIDKVPNSLGSMKTSHGEQMWRQSRKLSVERVILAGFAALGRSGELWAGMEQSDHKINICAMNIWVNNHTGFTIVGFGIQKPLFLSPSHYSLRSLKQLM